MEKNRERFLKEFDVDSIVVFGDGQDPKMPDFTDLGRKVAGLLGVNGGVLVATHPSYIADHIRRGIPYDYGGEYGSLQKAIEDGIPEHFRGKLSYGSPPFARVPEIGTIGFEILTKVER